MFKITRDCGHKAHYGHIRSETGVPIADIHMGLATVEAERLVYLANHAKELQARLDDIHDTQRIILEDKGAHDEVHCTCVPTLRVKIAELEADFYRIAQAVLGDIREGEASADAVIKYVREAEELHRHDCDRAETAEARVKELERQLSAETEVSRDRAEKYGECQRELGEHVGINSELTERVAELEKDLEQEREAGEQRNTACGDALEKLWQEIVIAKSPDYGEWAYPGQAYRHLKAEYDDLRERVAELETKLVAAQSAARLCAGADLDAQERVEKAEARVKKLEKEFELAKCPGPRDCKDYVGMELRLYGLKQKAETELERARAELSTCDDIPLDAPLADQVGTLQRAREKAESDLAELSRHYAEKVALVDRITHGARQSEDGLRERITELEGERAAIGIEYIRSRDQLRERLSKAEAERDEAKEEAQKLAGAYIEAEQAVFDDIRERAEKAEAELAKARVKITELTIDRDDGLVGMEKAIANNDEIIRKLADLETAINSTKRERDEAIGQVQRLQAIVQKAGA